MNSDLPNPENDDTPEDQPIADFTDFSTPPVEGLNRKILDAFPGLVVRKDLTKGLKQNAVVPTYVLEYLLGQHCATDDPTTMKAGLESVQRILAKHYVHRNEAALVRSTIKEKGRHKVIDKLTVDLNDKGGFYEAEFTNLGIKKVPVADDFVRRYPNFSSGGSGASSMWFTKCPSNQRRARGRLRPSSRSKWPRWTSKSFSRLAASLPQRNGWMF